MAIDQPAAADQFSGSAERLKSFLSAASPWLLVVLCLALWAGLTAFNVIDARDVSSPLIVAQMVWEWTITGYIVPHLYTTCMEVLIGYVSGTLIGLVVAFLFFFFPRVERMFGLLVTLLNAVPRAILAPFAVLAFGIGMAPKIVLVALVVSIITLVNLSAGLRDVDRTLVNNARVFGANYRELMVHVYIPAALVWIVAAMRNSVGHAFTAAILCELMGATAGIGWLIAVGQATIKPEWIMAGLFFAAAIVLLFDLIILAPLERRGSHWRVF
jgi:NitT/TauT family transport system permease protein